MKLRIVGRPLAWLVLLLGLLATGGESTRLQAADWPHWRGPARTGVVNEPSGYKPGQAWPRKELWQARLGEGSNSPLLIGNQVFGFGWGQGSDHVTCLDLATGKTAWQAKHETSRFGRFATGDQGLYGGPNSTPEFDLATGLLYTLGGDGDLICWNTKQQGKRVWEMNLYDRYAAVRRPKVGRSGLRDYGYTSSPLIVNDWLLVEVGSPQTLLVAFDKNTGKEAWRSEAQGPAGHNGGPALMQVEGVPCVAVLSHFKLYVIRLDGGRAGQTVASFDWLTEFANNIVQVVAHRNSVLITSGYNHQKMCRLDIGREGARKVWEVDSFSKVCTPIVHKDNIYWCWRSIQCADWASGKLRWASKPEFGDPGSCILTSDDRLISWARRGDLVLAETAERSPTAYKELARRSVLRSDAWPHVVLANGHLLCKDRLGNVKCFQP